MNRRPDALLLDLDDTILDDSGSTDLYWRGAIDAHRAELGAIEPETLHAAIVRARRWFWGDPERHRTGRLDLGAARAEVARLALAELGIGAGGGAGAGDGDGDGAPTLAASIARDYAARKEASIAPLEGAIETVRWFRESGCRMALLTNGSAAAQTAKIERFGLAAYFDVVLIEGAVGYGKPDPRIYDLALERLDAAPDAAWMVGDNLDWDVAGPQRAGIRAVWVDRRGTGLPDAHPVRPDRIVRALSELRAAFD
ncbi:MAG TPA: HAD family hydrolase [Candidatus Eisenbacteria bacterium]|nr:HAD family hydrolase [Candidatus Eisenbacteria bacterium]